MTNSESIILDTGTKVHITGKQNKKPDDYPTWIAKYRDETKHPKMKLKCAVAFCKYENKQDETYGKLNNDLSGAHVRIDGSDYKHLIIPFCSHHNSPIYWYQKYKNGLIINKTEAIRVLKAKVKTQIDKRSGNCVIL